MAYHSKYSGAEVDALLDKIKDDDVGSIDSSLSTTSENPVKNKVITEELNKKANKTDIATINGKPLTNGGNIEVATIAYDDTEIKDKLTELSLKVGKFAEVTEQSATPTFTINATNYERNTIVHCGVLSSLTIASITAIPMEVNIRFATGASVDDFLNIPADAKKVGEVTCEASSEYVMSILDGVIILGKVE